MVVAEADEVDAREVVQVDCRIGLSGAGHAGTEVDVVAAVEKIGLGGCKFYGLIGGVEECERRSSGACRAILWLTC